MFLSAAEVEADFTADAWANFAPEPLPVLRVDTVLQLAADGSTSFTVVSFFFPVPVDRFS